MKSPEIDNNPEIFELKKSKYNDEQVKILESFTLEQQTQIVEKLKILSVIPKIIGRDFDMPVELNQPKGGWHWDFKANVVRVDPVDLLEKPIDYLRFVMAHEGGHRRITKTDFIPTKTWQQRGFSVLMNSIEDPRDNNFLADTYPRFREEAHLAYDLVMQEAEKSKSEALGQLGQIPRFSQASWEFIRLWYSWFKKEPMQIDESLPAEVKDVLKKVLISAEDAWRRYPTREETDGEQGQETTRAYAKVAYEIILEEIWPEFQKLIEKDLEDQKLEEYLKQLEQEKQEKKEKGEGEEGQSDLTPAEQEELEKALEKAIDEAVKDDQKEKEKEVGEGQESGSEKSPKGQAIPLDSLSPELKEKLKQKIASLSEEEKKKLAETADKALGDFEKTLNDKLQGEMTESPEEREIRTAEEQAENSEEEKKDAEKSDKESKQEKNGADDKKSKEEEKQEKENEEKKKQKLDKLRSELEEITKGEQTVYEENRREVQPIINSLTSELRNIFRKRRENKYEAGRKSGRHIDIATRIKEIAKGINAFDSRAWVRREAPQEKDYAITLLADLSGSMKGGKIAETFKAVIVLTEVLSQLGIKTEILGFNDRLHEYLPFGHKLSQEVKDQMAIMLEEVRSSRASYNDDGWAVEEASKRLAKQQEIERIMIVLSDGLPEESEEHGGQEYELKSVVDKIVAKGKEKVIGLGIGRGTEHVSHYYPHSIANVSVEEMAQKLADLIVRVIEGQDKI